LYTHCIRCCCVRVQKRKLSGNDDPSDDDSTGKSIKKGRSISKVPKREIPKVPKRDIVKEINKIAEEFIGKKDSALKQAILDLNIPDVDENRLEKWGDIRVDATNIRSTTTKKLLVSMIHDKKCPRPITDRLEPDERCELCFCECKSGKALSFCYSCEQGKTRNKQA
jgi:hypothetical protein